MTDRKPLLHNDEDYDEIHGVPMDHRTNVNSTGHTIIGIPLENSSSDNNNNSNNNNTPTNVHNGVTYNSSIEHNNNNNNNNTTPTVNKKKRKDKVPSLYVAEKEQPISYDDYGITDDTNPSEVKHQIQNHMFGFKPFKSKLTKRRIEERSPEVQHLYTNEQDKKPENSSNSVPNLIGNVIYSATFGVILFIVFTLSSVLLTITYFGIPYGRLFWRLKGFVLWPFGKYLQLSNNVPFGQDEERLPISNGSSSGRRRAQIAVRKLTLYNYMGAFIYYVLIAPIIIIFETLVLSITWMIVVSIPTAKIHTKLLTHLLCNPLLLRTEDYPRGDCQILLYPVEAFNKYYYKYSINGMNVVLVNLLPFVIISLIFGFFLEDHIDPIVIFICCLLSTIPLSYYNGMAIASLSAQTSFAIGALINASFGSIIELILYIVSINGAQEEVARSALTGALLGSMLLIPGLSMIIGGLKHKEQRFNPTLMGVNTILLMIAVVAAFAPTLFYKVYGSFGFSCSNCIQQPIVNVTDGTVTNSNMMDCGKCSIVASDLDDDPIYTHKARTLMYICSGILPLTYFIGLLFTLKTHTHILHAPLEKLQPAKPPVPASVTPANASSNATHQHVGGGADHEKPKEKPIEYEWSKVQCIIVLFACTTMFALVSEKLVGTIDPVVNALGLTHEFLGVTILGIIPSAAEYLNAVQFALHNNMPLALEIGASAAVQITLFQMPVLVFICAIINHLSSQGSFTLIFPLMDFFAIFFGVMVMNLVFSNGRTNYFIGSTLVIIYLVIVFCFYFTPN